MSRISSQAIKHFQWRPPATLYDDVQKIARRAGTSMNYEVTRLVRSGIDRDKQEAKK